MSPACLAPPHHLVVQVLLRHRKETLTLEFAQSAMRIVTASDSYLACPVGAGLLLYGVNEQCLSRPLADLHERYHGCLDQIGPCARLIEEGGLLEPLMHVRVRVHLEHVDAVKRELLLRDARILEQDVVALRYQAPREGVLRARATMERLIGFPAALQAIAGGTAQHLIALDCYEPVPAGQIRP